MGNDTFVYLKKDAVDGAGMALGTDTISDFGAGDRLDLKDFFKYVQPADVAQSIKLAYDGANTTLSVQVHDGFVDVAALRGDFGSDTSQFAAGYILAH